MTAISIDVRAGLRAAVAVALASAVGHLFALQRSYWAIMVAVVVLAETWGASLQKAVQRAGATAAGCIIGWGVQRLAGRSEWIQVLLLLLCIFLAIYFRGYSYPWMMFFITVYVVFLFSLLGEWNASIAIVRLKDTAVGGAVAVAATMIVPPIRAHQLRADLAALWKCAQAQLATALATVAPLQPERDATEACQDNLYSTVETLRTHMSLAPYENILRPLTVGRIRAIVEQTEALVRHVLMFAEIVRASSPHRLGPLTPELEHMGAEVMATVHSLTADSPARDGSAVAEACDRVQRRAEELHLAGDIGSDELLTICSITFHLQAAGRAVSEIIDLRRQLPGAPAAPAAQDLAVSA